MTENLINHIRKSLQDMYPPGEVRSLTRRILLHVCGREPYHFLADPGLHPGQRQLGGINRIIERLRNREPIQYITGETTFCGCSIHVNRHTLIPRPETEELTALVVTHIGDAARSARTADNRLRLLDICTGSGCIAVALARSIPGAEVTALDVSAEALRTASVNAERNGVEIALVEADICWPAERAASLFSEAFDLMVSNPPYIPYGEKPGMPANVTMYEPQLALFVPDSEPLRFYHRIAGFAMRMLKEGGALWLEINARFGSDTCRLLSAEGFRSVELLRDLSGKDRFIRAIR
ncbi:MAG: peptide chain release factor N(5)-glutamine methyltransferase [Tannerellaceae bacterium]|jgi:release factor glutamine methyltransferase|nr:peptide chain release factor N(5)-glutamine methyltransferase [Tannerellaceae bacterium]